MDPHVLDIVADRIGRELELNRGSTTVRNTRYLIDAALAGRATGQTSALIAAGQALKAAGTDFAIVMDTQRHADIIANRVEIRGNFRLGHEIIWLGCQLTGRRPVLLFDSSAILALETDAKAASDLLKALDSLEYEARAIAGEGWRARLQEACSQARAAVRKAKVQ